MLSFLWRFLPRFQIASGGRRVCEFVLLALAMVLWETGCDQPVFQNDLEAVKSRGELRVITQNNGTCYYEGALGPVGFEYDLARALARYLGVRLKVVVLDDYRSMASTLLAGDADLIAGGLTVSDHLRRHLALGPIYRRVDQVVVGLRSGPHLDGVQDLFGKSIWVSAGTPSERSLTKLKAQNPALSWMSVSNYEPEELLEMVWRGVVPLAVAASDVVAINRRYYPELEAKFAIEKGQSLAWAMHPQSRHLQREVARWFSRPATTTLLEQLVEHYFEQDFDYVDLMRYRRRVRDRLPRFREYFEQAAKECRLDWRLIAAQSYQESHWNPKAESFTGVKGMMMLTLQTVKDLNVTDRLDPWQAISAGAQYLSQLHDRVGGQVPEPDRTYMALAAYNVGWDHLQDARALAVRLGRSANAWHAVRSTLPLLRLKKYYATLPHGYARGNEPVQYVDRIRIYCRILVRETKDAEPEIAPAATATEDHSPPSEN